jgi:hypothetical protein
VLPHTNHNSSVNCYYFSQILTVWISVSYLISLSLCFLIHKRWILLITVSSLSQGCWDVFHTLTVKVLWKPQGTKQSPLLMWKIYSIERQSWNEIAIFEQNPKSDCECRRKITTGCANHECLCQAHIRMHVCLVCKGVWPHIGLFGYKPPQTDSNYYKQHQHTVKKKPKKPPLHCLVMSGHRRATM